MAYVLPQVQVFQQVLTVPATSAHPLPACIIGGNAALVRYTQPTERQLGFLGYYDSLVDTTYSWPNRAAGAAVDPTYTQVTVNKALLQYFDNPIDADDVLTKVANYPNRITAAATNFATSPGYSRAGSLLDRDVQPGDTVRVRYVIGSTPGELWTYVQGLQPTQVSAVVGTATKESDNAGAQSASAAAALVAGPVNCVDITANGSLYNGLPSGYIAEQYTIVVLDGSAGGDFTSARLRVVSASGTDDVLSLTPAAASSPTPIGTRGLTATFAIAPSGACSASADSEHVNPEDLVAGQTWLVTVHQAFTAPTPTSAGTYSSTESLTYIVEVVAGGLYSASPQIRVSTDTGTDVSGPTVVSSSGVAVPVGTRGVTIAFSGTGLRFGDRYAIPVTGVGAGPLCTLVLGNTLPTGVTNGSRVGVTLFINATDLVLPQDREGYAPLTNWDQDAVSVTLNSGALAYDPSWTSSGVPQPLPVVSSSAQGYGGVYVTYRAWLADLVGSVNSLTDVGSLATAIPGSIDPDNPLSYAVSKALANAGTGTGGAPVYYTAVNDPSNPNDWANALGLLVGLDTAYGLVPLSHDPTVLSLFQAHVNDESTPITDAWRVAWFALQGVSTVPIVSAGSTVPGYTPATTSDGGTCLVTFTADPLAAGTVYTIVTCPANNGNFLTNNVLPGDIVRGLYVGDGFGNTTYQDFVVDAVLAQDQLRVTAGPGSAQTVPAKCEIWRNLSLSQQASAIARQAGAYGSNRIRAVWPDTVQDGATTVDGYYLCAALAALAGAVLPHQSLTRVTVSGFTAVPRSTQYNRDQLNTIASGGGWVVTADPVTGAIFNRHGITTNTSGNLELQEEMVVRNLDSISFRFRDEFAPYIGITNAVPSMVLQITAQANTLIKVLQSELYTPQLGGQLVSATVTTAQISPTASDAIDLVISCVLPDALNNLNIYLQV